MSKNNMTVSTEGIMQIQQRIATTNNKANSVTDQIHNVFEELVESCKGDGTYSIKDAFEAIMANHSGRRYDQVDALVKHLSLTIENYECAEGTNREYAMLFNNSVSNESGESLSIYGDCEQYSEKLKKMYY